MTHRRQNFMGGAAILAGAVAVTKLLGAVYKIPLGNLLDKEGMAHFYAAYNIYNLLLVLSTAGLPVALSRMVSRAAAQRRYGAVRRCLHLGLALLAAGDLLDFAPGPAPRHLLILLTDASPDDSHKILPSGKVPLSRDYDGQIGVDDTAEEVRALRAQGIRVAAVFMGENASVPAANAIYGRDLARIRRIDQLAATAGRLIQDEIRELSG